MALNGKMVRLGPFVCVLAASVIGLPTALAGDINPAVIATVPVGSSPFAIGVNPITSRIYVANSGAYGSSGNTVSVIDGATNTVTTTIPVGSGPDGVGVNAVTNSIYVANFYSDTVSVIDGAGNTVTASVAVGSRPIGVAVNPVTNRVFVANRDSNTVSVIDGATNTLLATIPVGTEPVAIDVNPTTDVVYVTNSFVASPGTVSVIDGSANTVIATIPVGSSPQDVGVNPITNRVYVGNAFSNTVSVIDGTTNGVISTISVGVRPVGLGVNSATDRAYVANLSSGTVSVIDTTANSVVATVPVGSIPTGVGIDSIANLAYVTNELSNTVSVIGNATALDFSFGPIAPIRVNIGGSASSSVTLNSVNGSSSPVTLSVSGSPNGVSASLSPNLVTPPSGGIASSTLGLTVSPFVTPGTISLTIVGISGSLSHSTSATVTVVASPSDVSTVVTQLLAGCIDNSGIANALIAKLSAAQSAITAGNLKTAINILSAFIDQVRAQSGTHILASCTMAGVTINPAAVLIADAQSIIDSLMATADPNPITGSVVTSMGPAVAGATLSLVNSTGTTLATATTDVTGFYFFATTGLLTSGAIYSVSLTGLPTGFTTSSPPAPTFTWAGNPMPLSNFILT